MVIIVLATHLVWSIYFKYSFYRSGLEHDDMKIFYNYLITSLFPAHFSTSDIQVCSAYLYRMYAYWCYMLVWFILQQSGATHFQFATHAPTSQSPQGGW